MGIKIVGGGAIKKCSGLPLTTVTERAVHCYLPGVTSSLSLSAAFRLCGHLGGD